MYRPSKVVFTEFVHKGVIQACVRGEHALSRVMYDM